MQETKKALSLFQTNKQIHKMTIKNVTLGDKFINPANRKSGRISTVIDFIEHKSLVSGKVVKYEVVAQHEFMGQILTTNCCVVTVLRNKVNK